MAGRRLESSRSRPETAEPTMTLLGSDTLLAQDADPCGFVMAAYPWGEKGTEPEHQTGPDDNERQFLEGIGKELAARGFDGTAPVMPILVTATSGHGTGKSGMGAGIGEWILSARPDSIGTVAAGTWPQLESRTWAALQYWTKLCITGHWFQIQARGTFHKERPKTWQVVAQTSKENEAPSFAGPHAATSTSWYMFDAASLVPDKVWDCGLAPRSEAIFSSVSMAGGARVRHQPQQQAGDRVQGRDAQTRFGLSRRRRRLCLDLRPSSGAGGEERARRRGRVFEDCKVVQCLAIRRTRRMDEVSDPALRRSLLPSKMDARGPGWPRKSESN